MSAAKTFVTCVAAIPRLLLALKCVRIDGVSSIARANAYEALPPVERAIARFCVAFRPETLLLEMLKLGSGGADSAVQTSHTRAFLAQKASAARFRIFISAGAALV